MIITNNEDALRLKCEDVSTNDFSEVGEIINLLEKELDIANKLGKGGVGLAAPQIGIAKNVAIIRYDKYKINLANAKLEKGYNLSLFNGEGCLSFPNKLEDTMRYQEVHISNNFVYPNNFIATGFLAVVCQHELDHLNSIIFTDRKVIKQLGNKKPGPNDPCICGSNIKFKKCCKNK